MERRGDTNHSASVGNNRFQIITKIPRQIQFYYFIDKYLPRNLWKQAVKRVGGWERGKTLERDKEKEKDRETDEIKQRLVGKWEEEASNTMMLRTVTKRPRCNKILSWFNTVFQTKRVWSDALSWYFHVNLHYSRKLTNLMKRCQALSLCWIPFLFCRPCVFCLVFKFSF